MSGRVDVDDLRARHRLVDVAGRMGLGVPRTSGKAMVCCPLAEHADSTPSMQLDFTRDRFSCFGCRAHGDVIQLVKDIYSVGFRQAVAMLESSGPLPTPPGGQVSSRIVRMAATGSAPQPDRSTSVEVLAALADAWAYYSAAPRHDVAVAYLAGRGIDIRALEAEVGDAVVGHTSPGWSSACDYLLALGHSTTVLVDAGLVRQFRADRPLADVYRGRVMLPVRLDDGQVAGFLGRDTSHREGAPKYLNPTRTVVYDKSVHLYRPSLCAPHVDGQVVVVEGSLDALAIAAMAAAHARTERYTALCASGVAVSAAQWRSIVRLAGATPIVLAADGDAAGAAANKRWSADLASLGHTSYVTTWPDGTDPASYLFEHGVGALDAVSVPQDRRLPQPPPAGRRLVVRACPGDGGDLAMKLEATSHLPVLRIGA